MGHLTPESLRAEIARREAAWLAEPTPETEIGHECRDAGAGYLDGLRVALPHVEGGAIDTLGAIIAATDRALCLWQEADPEPGFLVGAAQTRLTSHLRALKDVMRRMERKAVRS